MPATFFSEDHGEAWVWGDFFATLQKRPKMVAQVLQGLSGQGNKVPLIMDYPFAMSVFYRLDKNPHGPSHSPVITVALEKANYGVLIGMLGTDKSEISDIESLSAAPMIGLFTASGHMNFGDFDEPVTANSARKKFFEIIKNHLNVSGDPVKIGTIADVFGHPNTGWPVQEPTGHKSSTTGNGCLGLILAGVLLLPALYYGCCVI